MHRNHVIQLLNAYGLAWADESETVERFIRFVTEHPDCFERSLITGHVTGSAWVVNQAGTHVLLTHHRKLNRWLQLGGHADGDPDILAVALREVREESGLDSVAPVMNAIFDVDIHLIPERKSEPAHFHYDIRFAVQASGREDYAVSEESHDLGWIEIDQLDRVTDEPSMLRMASKWKAFRKTEKNLQTPQ